MCADCERLWFVRGTRLASHAVCVSRLPLLGSAPRDPTAAAVDTRPATASQPPAHAAHRRGWCSAPSRGERALSAVSLAGAALWRGLPHALSPFEREWRRLQPPSPTSVVGCSDRCSAVASSPPWT